MSTIEKALEKLQQGGEAINSHVPMTEKSHANENLERALHDVSQVKTAQIHSHTSRKRNLDLERLARSGFLTPESGRSQLAEEMRHIKRPILLNTVNATSENPVANLIMVTSARPSEGKSFTSLNLAMSIAKERDKTVLLVDADIAKPGLTRLLDMDSEKGLVDYLLDDTLDLSDVIIKTNVPSFRFIPAGRRHIHSTELLASQSMIALAHDLSKRYPDRIVIFDSPPLLATSEAAVVSSLVGQIIMVVEAEKTSKQELNESLGLIDQSDKYVGLVLNKTRGSFGSEYYGYYSSYGD